MLMRRIPTFPLLCLLLAILLHHLSVSVFAFAAKKKGGKKKVTASTNRGFGKAPPTLDETLVTFKTRIPESAEGKPCPCGVSGKTYGTCCGPYLRGLTKPMSATAVLQSRYTAFCWRNIGYIMQTTHPSCRDYNADPVAFAKDLNKNGMFDSFEFIGLKILGEEEKVNNDTEAFIEFQVKLQANERTGSLLEGQVTTIQERSKFLRDEATGSWSYASGDVRSTVQGVDDVILNA